MSAEKANHSVRTLCRVLRVSKSGYFAWLAREPSARALEDARLTHLIRRIHADSHGTYGAPRIRVELREVHGVSVGQKRVARLMRAAALQGVHRRRTQPGEAPSDPGPRLGVFEDLVRRDFTAAAPNHLWVADVTQHPTSEGWLYVAAVLDVFDRRIVGWSMGAHAQTELVVDAVNMAVMNRRPEPGLIHHSDRGSQFGSLAFGRRLQAAGIVGSMGSRGDAYDNAAMESFWATLQTELFDRRAWDTRSQLRTATFHFIEVFYNRQRRHSALGNLSPAEYGRRHAQRQATA